MTIAHGMKRLAAALCIAFFSIGAAHAGTPSLGKGVNLWDLEFCGGQPNLRPAVDYLYGKGMRLFRIPLPWEVSQRALNGPLNEEYMAVYDTAVNYVLSKPGARVIVDLHAFMGYYVGGNYHRGPNETLPNGSVFYSNGLPCVEGGTKAVVGSADVPLGALANMWTRLATRYPDPRIIYEIMNEPFDVPEAVIFSEQRAAMLAIRALGRTNTIAISVEDNGDLCNYGGFCSGQTNIQTLVAADPQHATIADVHNYFDNGSGQSATCNAGMGKAHIATMMAWVNLYKIPFITGELGGGANEQCRREVTDYLSKTRLSPYHRGWTWWAAGQANGGYIYQLVPGSLSLPVADKPQMNWLRPFMP